MWAACRQQLANKTTSAVCCLLPRLAAGPPALRHPNNTTTQTQGTKHRHNAQAQPCPAPPQHCPTRLCVGDVVGHDLGHLGEVPAIPLPHPHGVRVQLLVQVVQQADGLRWRGRAGRQGGRQGAGREGGAESARAAVRDRRFQPGPQAGIPLHARSTKAAAAASPPSPASRLASQPASQPAGPLARPASAAPARSWCRPCLART